MFAQNIDCGYTINRLIAVLRVPTIYVLEQNQEIIYTRVSPKLQDKSGVLGLLITRACFH